MKRLLAGLTVLAMTLSTITALGAGSPVAATHQVTRYEKGEDFATIGFTVHLVNRSDKALSNLSLRVMRLRYLVGKTPVISVATLGAGESTDISFEIQAPASLPKERIQRQPLLLAGKCVDAAGNVLEFPARSNPGGAR